MSASTLHHRIDGAALASLLHSAAVARRDVDGLLFGHRSVQETKEVTDSEEERTRRDVSVAVTCIHCSASLQTFYDAAGDLLPSSPQMLTALEAQYRCSLLGWIVVRQHSPSEGNWRGQQLLPSMREMSVTRQLSSLCSAVSGESLLTVISLEAGNEASTHTYKYQMYRQLEDSVPLRLRPVDLEVSNIGSMAQHTSTLRTCSPAANTNRLGGMRIDGDEYRADVVTQALQSANTAQTAAVEAMYNQLLDRLEAVAKIVAAKTQEVEKQRQLNISMRTRLGAGTASKGPMAAATDLRAIDLNP